MISKPGLPTELMKGGVSFVCAHCKHMWWSVQHGHRSCRTALKGDFCKGPVGAKPRCFPLYDGELEGKLVNFCFVCGEKPDAAVEIPHKTGGMLGVCKEHIEILESYSGDRERPAFITKKYVPLIDG